MNRGGYGALLGLSVAIGMLILISGLSRSRKPSLLDQISPYIPTSRNMRTLQRKQPGVVDLVVALITPLLQRNPTHANSKNA